MNSTLLQKILSFGIFTAVWLTAFGVLSSILFRIPLDYVVGPDALLFVVLMALYIARVTSSDSQ